MKYTLTFLNWAYVERDVTVDMVYILLLPHGFILGLPKIVFDKLKVNKDPVCKR